MTDPLPDSFSGYQQLAGPDEMFGRDGQPLPAYREFASGLGACSLDEMDQRQRRSEMDLLASGITAWLGVQSLVNVGGAVGAIPVTGLALPLVSVGGSAMLVAMAGVGILVNIARNAPQVADSGPGRRRQ